MLRSTLFYRNLVSRLTISQKKKLIRLGNMKDCALSQWQNIVLHVDKKGINNTGMEIDQNGADESAKAPTWARGIMD